MKRINYTGSSKLISRIVAILNEKAPLPLDGDGDADWGTNGQVLTTDGQGNTSWTTPQGGGGDVTDVEVNGTSVVNAQGVAEVSVPTATSDLNNDSGFIDSTDLSTALADYTPTANLATIATSGDYDDLLNKPSIPAAQVQSDWTQADNTQVDYIKNKPSLATVATSGSYTDLTDKPTIPTALSDLTDDSTHRVVTDTQISTWNGKSDFSGSYNDLTDKPTIPTVNDGTLTIQQNGTTLGTFTANQSGNTTVNLTGGGSTYTEGDGIDISSQNVISVDTTFTEASTRTNIASGDNFATILGKIKKWFSDLANMFVSKTGDTMTGKLTISDGGLLVSGRPYGAGDDEGIVITPLSNGYAGVCLGNPSGRRSVFYLNNGNDAFWRYNNGSVSYDLLHPQKAGTIAVTSDIPDISTKVSKSGDTMTGALSIERSGNDTPLVLKRTDTTSSVYAAFRNSGGILGYLGVNNSKKPVFYDNQDHVLAYASDIPDISTKVSKSGDTMTGALELKTENSVCLNLRPGNASWFDTVSVQTSGQEAVVFASKNPATSWMFVSGEDSVTNHESTRWQSLTPALQIKNNKVAIGKLIANNSNLTYPLEVNGDVSATNFRGNLKGNADTVTHDTVNILSPVGFVISPGQTLDAGGFTYAIVSAYNNDQASSSPVIVYENNTYTMKIYNATQTFTVTSKRYIKNNSGSNYLYALCFQANTVWC